MTIAGRPPFDPDLAVITGSLLDEQQFLFPGDAPGPACWPLRHPALRRQQYPPTKAQSTIEMQVASIIRNDNRTPIFPITRHSPQLSPELGATGMRPPADQLMTARLPFRFIPPCLL
jgi:hypothetical protein